jgi:hypothetical protein
MGLSSPNGRVGRTWRQWQMRCRNNVFVGLVAIHLLLAVAIGGSIYVTGATAAEANLPAPTRPADVSEQTILHAFFERPDDPSCFVLGGLFVLRDDGVELAYPVALDPQLKAVVFWANYARGHGDAYEMVTMNLSDRGCLISLRVYEEIIRDGRWTKLRPPKPPEPRATSTDEHLPARADESQKPTGRPIDSLSDMLGRLNPPSSADAKADPFHADIAISRARFADIPATGCPRGAGLFAITQSGFHVVFREPRANLPFEVEQRSPSDDKWIDLVLSTQTCRITIRVSKWLDAATFRHRQVQQSATSAGSHWLQLAPVQ